MTATNRARLVLLISPLLFVGDLLAILLFAVIEAVKVFSASVAYGVSDWVRSWYRGIYRPARYGSVYDWTSCPDCGVRVTYQMLSAHERLYCHKAS